MLARRAALWIVVIVLAVAIVWVRSGGRYHINRAGRHTIPDLSVTSPLNQPGGAAAPAEAYEIYSALYASPNASPEDEPLAFAVDSATDIPQLNGSCLKPTTAEQREMAEAFVVANIQSHKWEQRFAIPNGYCLLDRNEAAQAEKCIETHGQDTAGCARFGTLRHVRSLGVPGFNREHTRALVSVLKLCGGDCGNGGIFEIEKTGVTWRRADTSDFTRDCSWMYSK
jgi:hypothetical protein